MRHVYLMLCIIGAVWPLAHFFPFVLAHGLDIPYFLQQLWVNDISRFFAADVVCSAITCVSFMMVEGRRIGMRQPWRAAAGLLVGVSLALPLFLWLRQRHLEQHGQPVLA